MIRFRFRKKVLVLTHTEVSNYINTKKRTIKFNFDLNQGVGTDG